MRIEYINSARIDVTEIRNNLSQYYPSTPLKFLKALKKSVETLRDNPLVASYVLQSLIFFHSRVFDLSYPKSPAPHILRARDFILLNIGQ